jgi:hypothetical protein
MKIVTLIPVKNEGDFLEQTLKNVCSFSDHVIIADQSSTDNTREICKKFSKVIVIDNPNEGHSNRVRWLLLDQARKLGTDNLIFCIDADEMISPKIVDEIKEFLLTNKSVPGVAIGFKWIQLWNSLEKHRIDGVWKDNIKVTAFWDDGKTDYDRRPVINDHTSRVPIASSVQMSTYPLLHLQSLSVKKYEIKQAWYRCSELIAKNNARKINYKYSVTDKSNLILEDTKNEWFDDIDIKPIDYIKENDWHYMEILRWFNQYGVEFFEPIDIWNTVELLDKFIKKMNRRPEIKIFPKWLLEFNKIKNVIRNKIYLLKNEKRS